MGAVPHHWIRVVFWGIEQIKKGVLIVTPQREEYELTCNSQIICHRTTRIVNIFIAKCLDVIWLSARNAVG